MPTSTITTQPVAQLTPEHRRELTLAKGRFRAIQRAANVAGFNGWTTALIAALSVPFALFSLVGFLLTVGLAVVAYNEFQGRKRLLNLEPRAAALLGWNQIGLFAAIAAYSFWMLLTSVGSFAAQLQSNPELKSALGSLDQFDYLYRRIVVSFYATVILLSAIFQGLNALYYFTRRKHIDVYLKETPAWVQEIKRFTSAA